MPYKTPALYHRYTVVLTSTLVCSILDTTTMTIRIDEIWLLPLIIFQYPCLNSILLNLTNIYRSCSLHLVVYENWEIGARIVSNNQGIQQPWTVTFKLRPTSMTLIYPWTGLQSNCDVSILVDPYLSNPFHQEELEAPGGTATSRFIIVMTNPELPQYIFYFFFLVLKVPCGNMPMGPIL